MSESVDTKAQREKLFSVLRVLAASLVAITIVFYFLVPGGVPRRQAKRVRCLANLKMLRVALAVYADDHAGQYPPAERWCDVLVAEFGEDESFKDNFQCPKAETGPCNYAMNPLADPNSASNVVLLFESKPGWNQFGGPELLTMKNHEGKGCCVSFVDGSVKFVKTEEIVGLKWQDEKTLPPELRNARRPANDAELKYWLENMVWYHRFSTEEVRLATGLTVEEVRVAQERLDVWPDGRPERDADAPLLVLPYPGGRHPRIGFLEGAIDPQRETKFSVFTPWDPNSYAVLDIPEAIWSNLGLTYLAHTHIDTIWSKQGIELEKLEWNRRADGSLDFERVLPNGLAFGVKVQPRKEAVLMEMWLRNGTTGKLSDLRVQNCVMPKMAAGFAALTNENKVFTDPYVACRNEEGTRWIITAWEGCERPWGNEDCPCFHSDPKFPDLEPGQEHRLRGWLSFYEGEDIEAEFERIEATGWRQATGAE